MAKLDFAASQIQSTTNMIKSGDTTTAWTDDKYLSAKATIDKAHPKDSVLITSANVSPATTIGGEWVLIDKEYSNTVTALDGSSYWTPTMSGTTPSAELSGFVIRTNHLIHLTMQFTTKIETSTTNNSYTLGTIDHTKIGGVSNTPMSFGFTGSNFANAVYVNGSATESCSIRYGIGSTGSITIYEVFNTSKKLPSDATIYINVSVPMDPEYMGDSFCDKFYWKRTNTLAGTSTSIGYIRGDLNGDGEVTKDDAIYLKMFLSEPDSYPLYQSGDMDGDGDVDIDDATYLEMHSFYPENYLLASEGLKFTSNEDDTCYVRDIGACREVNIVVPSKSPAGDEITGIGPAAFKDCTNLITITIPNVITSISENAFENCTSLTTINCNFTEGTIEGAPWGAPNAAIIYKNA